MRYGAQGKTLASKPTARWQLQVSIQASSSALLLALLGAFTFIFGLSNPEFVFEDILHIFFFSGDIVYAEAFFKPDLEARHGGSICTSLICKPEPVLFVLHLLIKTGLV